MKYFVIFLILIVLVVIASTNVSYGLWVSKTPEKLFEQSETVFVGTITSVNVLEFERSNTYNVEENGISRIVIENYTQVLDEYTVNIEEFLKNPRESNTITMLEATVGGVFGRNVSIGGFELGDRVLFYVPKIDGTNQYSPESFKIPKQCDAKTVLEQPKITLANDFRMMQDGITLNDNFTANKTIQFVYNRDMRTLEGKSFDVDISISKILDNNNRQIAIQENIHTESKLCEWISTASWEFVPTAGKYSMLMHTSQGNGTGGGTVSSSFTVIENISEPDPPSIDISLNNGTKSEFYTNDIIQLTITIPPAYKSQNVTVSFTEPSDIRFDDISLYTNDNGKAYVEFEIPGSADIGKYLVTARLSDWNYERIEDFERFSIVSHDIEADYVDFRNASGEPIEVGCSVGLSAPDNDYFGGDFLQFLKCNLSATLVLVLALLGIIVVIIFIIWRIRK